ncbi:MAG: hypothetical protein HZC36_01665 [Armatimonadetes bacterium]|nr:hypothetical protein [Armatimonadota bacterium]
MQPKRKLAAILFVDIVGYTSRANQDEREALEVRDDVERIVRSSTLGHLGRVVKTLGDGAMLEFSSAVEAVTAALEIQEHLHEFNQRRALPEPVQVRIGAHVGDVVEEDNDLFGNAVNIASRVLGMAKPGGICITREVYVQIRPILNLHCTPVSISGEKSMPEPVEVFAIDGSEALRRGAAKTGRFLSVAVGLLVVLCALYAGNLYFNREPTYGGTAAETHRLLLPDWVSPGDWFPLDAGRESAQLSVFFGNRQAQSKVVDGVMLVQAPPDLPTNSTTISVFKGNESKPLMSQMTQVINPMRVASNMPVDPAVDLPAAHNRKEAAGSEESTNKKPTDERGATPSEPGRSTPAAAKGTGKPPAPPSTAFTGQASHRPRPGLPPSGYEKLVMSIPTGDMSDFKLEFGDMPHLGEGFKQAMSVVTLAAQGKNQQCEIVIRDLKGKMAHLTPEQAKEVESLVKSAEAMMAEREKKGSPEVRRRYADAFAFSMNNGTNNLAGIAMVNRLVREQNFEEARRAIAFLRKKGNLSQGEIKALDSLEKKMAGGPEPSQTRTGAGSEEP